DISLDTAESIKRGTCTVDSRIQPSTDMHTLPTPPTANIKSVTAIGPTQATIVLGNGERVPLTGDLAIVGRQSDCQILIDDNNVSRIHAEIRRSDDGWVVTDRGSTNGSSVNGEKITEGRLLVNGDTVAFGSAIVQFENS
ncbi:MAG: FHA domain-containing protein, partial [Ilumatobacteraceae bacterium]